MEEGELTQHFGIEEYENMCHLMTKENHRSLKGIDQDCQLVRVGGLSL
jgi:hypothetical protein